MSPVNHNIINKTTWIKIVHTLMKNFCQESDDKDNMNALENMGNDVCVIVGYHEKASDFMTMQDIFQTGITRMKCGLTNTEYNLIPFQDTVA